MQFISVKVIILKVDLKVDLKLILQKKTPLTRERSFRYLIKLIFVLLLSAGAYSQTVDRIAVIVNDGVVLESDIQLKIKNFKKDLKFKILEIGAHPYGEFKEGFHTLLDHFPGTEIYAFEVDKEECEKLNKSWK